MGNIIKSLLLIVGIAAIAAGVTRSTYSDMISSNNNSFEAGTMALELTNDYSGSQPFSIINIKPGWEKVLTYTVKNVGSVNGVVSLATANVDNIGAATGSSKFADGVGHLGQNIHIDVDYNGDGTYDALDFATLNNTAYNGTPVFSLPLNANTAQTIKIRLYVPSGVGNDIQGDSVKGSFTVSLNQS